MGMDYLLWLWTSLSISNVKWKNFLSSSFHVLSERILYLWSKKIGSWWCRIFIVNFLCISHLRISNPMKTLNGLLQPFGGLETSPCQLKWFKVDIGFLILTKRQERNPMSLRLWIRWHTILRSHLPSCSLKRRKPTIENKKLNHKGIDSQAFCLLVVKEVNSLIRKER